MFYSLQWKFNTNTMKSLLCVPSPQEGVLWKRLFLWSAIKHLWITINSHFLFTINSFCSCVFHPYWLALSLNRYNKAQYLKMQNIRRYKTSIKQNGNRYNRKRVSFQIVKQLLMGKSLRNNKSKVNGRCSHLKVVHIWHCIS